ncbi:type VII secretion protein EccB [Shewanella litorisediminis]|uniref:Type VII secretion protein EccB n=1 Tax=Shewanella litorisediminis TaxID=1173586 RepID=A0ABX7G4A2_9GAMM|nr:type VII secretion protein EccB [Shewanella litorisediminis]MCL2919971.1 type VII secretion protein EccB [Shewanella litorisediminis]QRH02145.1 type VII secretion protein EccB [Shewanella litorisediminis]
MTTQSFLLTPLAGSALWGAIGLLVGVILIGFFARRKPMTKTASAVATGIILAVVGLLGWIFIGALSPEARLEQDKLVLDLPAYSRTIPVSSLRLDEARVVAGSDANAPKLGFRTNGVGMPGYNLGWFRLKGDDAKALVSVTGDDPLLIIPVDEGYTLVLSTPDGAALLAALSSEKAR